MAAASLVGLGSIADLIRDHRRWAQLIPIRYRGVQTSIDSRVAPPAPRHSMEISAPCRRPPPGAASRAAAQTAAPQAPRSSRAPQHFLVGSTVGRGAGRVVNDEATRGLGVEQGKQSGRGSRRRYDPTGGAPQAQTFSEHARPVRGRAGYDELAAAPSAPFPHSRLAR